MRKTYLLPAILLAGLFACNDGGSKTEEPATGLKTASAADSNVQHHMPDSNLMIELPAIPDGAKVFFVNLKDGQTVTSPFKVQMGVEGIGLDSAGAIKPASGHHHILIDAGDSLEAGKAVPMDETHLHFGKAQSEAELTLPAGTHRITLQYADGIHRSYGAKLATAITVTVK